MTKQELAAVCIARLKAEYPDSDCTLDYDHAWQLLVSVRLAAQCTDARVNVVVQDLFAKYPGVKELAAASPEEIDRLNILNATRLAMRRAAERAPATLCVVDAVTGLDLPFPVRSVIRGAASSYHVAAASIVAKVTRDRQMRDYALQYPEYGFEHNMGYGTAEHIAALRAHGPTPAHRRTFLRHFVGEETAE